MCLGGPVLVGRRRVTAPRPLETILARAESKREPPAVMNNVKKGIPYKGNRQGL